MPSIRRRDALAALGAGAVLSTSGCLGTARDLVGEIRGYTHHADAPVASASTPWPQLGTGPGRTGSAPDATAPGGEATAGEVTPIGLFPTAQPAVAGDEAYLGVDRRRGVAGDAEDTFSGLIAVDLTSERSDEAVRWRVPEGGATTAFTPAVRGRVVYAQVGHGMGAYDAENGGREYWHNGAGGLPPAVDGRRVFTADTDGAVALDAVTGEVVWRSDPPSNAPSGVAVADGAVVLACGDSREGALYCYERDDGSERWRYGAVGESYATPVVGDGLVLVVGTDGELHAVEVQSGERRWLYALGEDSFQRVSYRDGVVYATGTNSDYCTAIDAETGEQRWRVRVGVSRVSPAALTESAAVLTTRTDEGGRLVVLDREDGRERARVPVPVPEVEETQPVVGDGVAYVVAEPRDRAVGVLYAVR
jgi:outer membrane protein assembly factor BamB